MKSKMKLAPVALAVAALFASPLAYAYDYEGGYGDDENGVNVSVSISNDISVHGHVRVKGKIWVNGEAAAAVDTDQRGTDNTVRSYGTDNTATVKGDALEKAKGNIGVNVGAGDNNAQTNDVALAVADSYKVFASATSIGKQESEDNSTKSFKTDNTASIKGDALRKARGNIGVNVAAGAGNLQGNALAASLASSSNLAKAVSGTRQEIDDNYSKSGRWSDNNASIKGDALQHARGNIGVNVASGNNNLQRNSLAVSVSMGGSSY